MKTKFLAVGDITTDSFIELLRAEIQPETEQESKQICMNFGDKIPFKDAVVVPAVGNSANAAVSASRLGAPSALLTSIGDDRGGEDCLSVLKSEKVDTSFIHIQKGAKTNHHYVLRYGAERTILVKHYEFDYVMPEFEAPEVIYLSSMAINSLSLQKEIASFAKNHPDTKLVFQPGTFQLELGYEKLKEIYENSYILFCNKEEAQRILDSKEDDIKKLLDEMTSRGPEVAVITDGKNGAFTKYEGKYIQMPMYPDPAPPVDRTGAGDAFSSTVTVALASGEGMKTALAWGAINSMSVVQYIGAQKGLLSKEQIEKYLQDAPSDFKVNLI